MLNKKLFRAELIKYTFKSMADALGISEQTFQTRFKTGDFRTTEIDILISLLNIDDSTKFFCARSNLASCKTRREVI